MAQIADKALPGVRTKFINPVQLNNEIALLKEAIRKICCVALDQLPSYVDDAAALAAGLKVGDWYVVTAGNDAIPEGVAKKIT